MALPFRPPPPPVIFPTHVRARPHARSRTVAGTSVSGRGGGRARRPAGSGHGRSIAAGLALCAAFGASGASALGFDCAMSGDRRHLQLELPGEQHLCEVSVTRRADAERQVVWYADNDTVYCSERLDELAATYRAERGFDCVRWPDPSGVDALDGTARAALDAELRALRDALRSRGDGARLTGVRVLARDGDADGKARPAGASADLRQFFVRDPDGSVRTLLRFTDDTGRTVSTDDLAASLSHGAERIDGVWVDSLDEAETTLHVVTSGRPPPTPGAPDAPDTPDAGASVTCRGAQTLSIAADGTLVPATPHRYGCDAGPLVALDSSGD